MEKVKNAALEKHSWLEKNSGLCNQQPVYVDPVVTVAQINAQREVHWLPLLYPPAVEGH